MKNRKNVKNIVITLALLIVLGGLIYTVYKSQEGFIRNAYEDAKRKSDELIGKPPESQEPVEIPSYILADSPDYQQFQEHNKNLHDIANDTSDYENSTYTKEYLKNIKTLYKICMESDTADVITLPCSFLSECPVELKCLKSYKTRNIDEILVPDNIWTGVTKDTLCHDEDGELYSGYTYYIIQTEITNVGSEAINPFLTDLAMEVLFLDKNGEEYWSDRICDFVSLQPGESEPHAYYYDFAPGDTISVEYVFTVPEKAFEYFDCFLCVSGTGDASYNEDNSRMILLENGDGH